MTSLPFFLRKQRKFGHSDGKMNNKTPMSTAGVAEDVYLVK